MRQVDEILSKICFPVDFKRKIPPLDKLASFKAFEMKNLFLYGLIPAIKGTLFINIYLKLRLAYLLDFSFFLQLDFFSRLFGTTS